MSSKWRNSQLLRLIVSDFLEMIREPGVLFWGILFPILMSLGLGLAFTRKQDVVRKVGIIVEYNQTSSVSASRIDAFLHAYTVETKAADEGEFYHSITVENEELGNTTFLFRKGSWDDAIVALKRGKFNVAIEETGDSISYYFDPHNPDAQLTYLKLVKLFGREPPVTVEKTGNIMPLTLEGTRYIDFLVPGLIAMGIMMSSMWGISYTIIERRTKKLLRRMISTPMKRSYFLLSIITVRAAMNFVEAVLLFLFTNFAFGIRIQGSLPALLAVFVAGNTAFAGIAIFISSRTAKTEIGNGLINVVVMPMTVLSGIFFSYHNFPDWAISFIQKLPLTMMADDIRSIFIEGAGFGVVSMHLLAMSSIGLLFFIAGIKVFKWH